MGNETKYMTVAEYARKYRVSPATVYRAVKSRGIESVRIGGAIRIPADAIPGAGKQECQNEDD
jgi:excisionase family DNA binding protein